MDLDETHSGEHTVFIMPPEEPQEPDGSECPARYRSVLTHSQAVFHTAKAYCSFLLFNSCVDTAMRRFLFCILSCLTGPRISSVSQQREVPPVVQHHVVPNRYNLLN